MPKPQNEYGTQKTQVAWVRAGSSASRATYTWASTAEAVVRRIEEVAGPL